MIINYQSFHFIFLPYAYYIDYGKERKYLFSYQTEKKMILPLNFQLGKYRYRSRR